MIDADDFDPPLLLGTAGYSDRDRLLFLAGLEYGRLVEHFEHDDDALLTPILRENESRLRVAAGWFGRDVRITPFDPPLDPEEMYSDLEITSRYECL